MLDPPATSPDGVLVVVTPIQRHWVRIIAAGTALLAFVVLVVGDPLYGIAGLLVGVVAHEQIHFVVARAQGEWLRFGVSDGLNMHGDGELEVSKRQAIARWLAPYASLVPLLIALIPLVDGDWRWFAVSALTANLIGCRPDLQLFAGIGSYPSSWRWADVARGWRGHQPDAADVLSPR